MSFQVLERGNMMEAIDRLDAMRREGIELSRNRNFEFFEDPENRAALSLSKYLRALADEIAEGARQGTLRLQVRPAGQALSVRVERVDLSVRHVAQLSRREAEWLADEGGVGELMQRAGYKPKR
ncbi:MAG: hypothetical protein H6744_10720 [Deltaproteobacteria bacterium]|nr:hypothetical protein [Deltaproteobacteria bacterium]MCB9787151.1 hypothetical protein [Deltaproteobacteria bacterium]